MKAEFAIYPRMFVCRSFFDVDLRGKDAAKTTIISWVSRFSDKHYLKTLGELWSNATKQNDQFSDFRRGIEAKHQTRLSPRAARLTFQFLPELVVYECRRSPSGEPGPRCTRVSSQRFCIL